MRIVGVFVSFLALLLIAAGFFWGAYHLAFHFDYFDWVQDTMISKALSYALIMLDAVLLAIAVFATAGAIVCACRKKVLFFHWVRNGDRVYAPDMSIRVTFEESFLVFWWDPVFQDGGMLVRHHLT